MKEQDFEFQIFAKPVGPACNLACRYCYYLGKKALYPGGKRLLMPEELLEEYIIQHFEASGNRDAYFSWHGGEPLLAGKDFFRRVKKYQEKHKPEGSSYFNGLQTNGTLLDDDWCRFLSDENFFIGLSIDGPAYLHNRYRVGVDGNATHDKVVKGFDRLVKYGITPEILCVVSSYNVKQPLKVYNYFKGLGARYMTFLPLVVRDSKNPSGVSDDSVPSGEFGLFLSRIFDEWIVKDIGSIKVQIFEEAARTAFGQEHTLCIFKKECGGVPVVEHTGDFYSCDHYVDPDHFLGNILDNSLVYYLGSEEQKAFGRAKLTGLPAYCRECEVLPMCNGECPRNRFRTTPDGEKGLNYLCTDYRQFFNHCRPFVDAVAQLWKNRQG
jgi:uncharacterized protein